MDIERAVDRLSHEIKEDHERKIIFIIGSGLSYPSIPGTGEMIEYFLSELGKSGEKVRSRIEKLELSEQYREAAQEVRSRRGDSGLTRAVQSAVATGRCPGVDDSINKSTQFDHDEWKVTEAQLMVAEVYQQIPGPRRGPIFTTNFDPLTEAAFGMKGIATTSLAVPGSEAFPIDSILSGIPIIHLHGIWSNGATLSTGVQLNHDRPDVEEMIKSYMNKALVVVIGYGGWEDSFMRAIAKMLKSGHLSSLQTEMMWLSHGKEHEASYHPMLSRMRGEAGVTLYFNIDATDFLTQLNSTLSGKEFYDDLNYQGWSAPPNLSLSAPERDEVLRFVQGAQPDWRTAMSLPVLSNAQIAIQRIEEEVAKNDPRMIILTGPTGEGKSATLKQIGLHFRDKYSSSLVLQREMGAPRISTDWVNEIKTRSDLSFVLVDEADLVIKQITESIRDSDSNTSGKVIWVLIMHSAIMRNNRVRSALGGVEYVEYEFSEITSEDAFKLANSWIESEMLPDSFTGASAHEISEMIEDASDSNHGKSLFGSVLHLWEGEELVDRVNDMLDKISRLQISGVSYRHILCSIAVMQVAWDLDETDGKGISTVMLGELVRIRSVDVLQLVVEPIGREVGISRVGDRIYIRHPTIAVAIYNLLEDAGELPEIVSELSRIGAHLRFSDTSYVEGAVEAYRLCTRLEPNLALSASIGAIKGSPGRLEPRVTEIAMLRSAGKLAAAQNYAKNLVAHLDSFQDRSTKQRGLFVEWANVERAMGHLDDSIKLSLRAVSDELDGFVWSETVAYALGNLCICLKPLLLLNREGVRQLLIDGEVMLETLKKYDWSSGLYSRESQHVSLLSLMSSFKDSAAMVTGSQFSFRKLQSVLRGSIEGDSK